MSGIMRAPNPNIVYFTIPIPSNLTVGDMVVCVKLSFRAVGVAVYDGTKFIHYPITGGAALFECTIAADKASLSVAVDDTLVDEAPLIAYIPGPNHA